MTEPQDNGKRTQGDLFDVFVQIYIYRCYTCSVHRSTTVIYQSNAIHTGNDKHAPYVIPLYQLVPEPLCIRHRDA